MVPWRGDQAAPKEDQPMSDSELPWFARRASEPLTDAGVSQTVVHEVAVRLTRTAIEARVESWLTARGLPDAEKASLRAAIRSTPTPKAPKPDPYVPDDAQPVSFLVGQRVVCLDEIAVVVTLDPGGAVVDSKGQMWLRRTTGYIGRFHISQVKPLPNGQL